MVSWYDTSKRFYNLNTNPDNNVIVTDFESGKQRYILKNSTPKLIHSFTFLLVSATDELNFFNWYSNTLLSRAETFSLNGLLDKTKIKEYRMTDEPTITGSQYPKECNITVKEV